jgi:hypothetical protein
LSEQEEPNVKLTYPRLQYASASSDNLTLASTGSGDIAEMTGTLADDEAAYAYVRMKLGNDEYSERVKFVFVVWAGMSSLLLLLLFFLYLSPPRPLLCFLTLSFPIR